jgi:hypothetical protein
MSNIRFYLPLIGAAITVAGPAFAQQAEVATPIFEGLPPHLSARVIRQEETVLPPGSGQQLRAVYESLKRWDPGSTLRVCFMSGRQDLRARIAAAADEWTKWGNLKIDFGNKQDPYLCRGPAIYEIRVGFGYRGYWSLVGKDSVNLADQHEQSMNFEGYDIVPPNEPEFSRVVFHEFGHALGFHHEHQNPASTCEEDFDWPKIYARLAGPPNNWSEETVNFNLRRLVNDGRFKVVGQFDTKSIMLYRFDAWMYKSGAASLCYSAQHNFILSADDKAAMLDAYPRDNIAGVMERRAVQAESLRTQLRAAPLAAGVRDRALDQLNAITSPDLSALARRDATQRLMAPR